MQINYFLSIVIVSQSISTAHKLAEEYRNWLRLFTFIDNAGRTMCQNILHEKENVPIDGKEFYSILQNYQKQMHFQIHKEILCPSDQFIDDSKFDLMIYTTVIQMMYGDKYKDVVQDLRIMRNQLGHMAKKSLSTEDFEKLWSRACSVFHKHGLKDDDIKFLNDIKTWEQFSAEECKGILNFFCHFHQDDSIFKLSETVMENIALKCLNTGDHFYLVFE